MTTPKKENIWEAIPAYFEKIEETPELSGEAADLLKSLFHRGPMSPPMQTAYAAVTEVLGLPVHFEDMDISFGCFTAEYNWESDTDFHFRNERIIFSNALYEAFKNPKQYGISHGIAEYIFLYAHELFHARFRHLVKQKILSKDMPMPMVTYNIAFDIFINTLLKYNDVLRSKCRDNPLNIRLFKSGMRYYEDKQDLEASLGRSVQMLDDLGVKATESELAQMNVLLNKKIEGFSDDELVELFYALFKDFMEEFQKSVDEAIEECKNEAQQGQGQGQNQSPGSQDPSDEDGEGGEGDEDGDGEGDDEKEGSGQGKKPQSMEQKISERIMDKLGEKARKDPKFAKAVKKFLGNFSSLPNVDMQVQMEGGMRGGVMTPKELAEAVRGRQAIQGEIEKIEEKYAGMVPGWMRSFADVPPKRPTYLSQLISFGNRHLGDTRATYSPPNKKRPGEILFSSRVGTHLELAFVIDTSGSMSADEISPVLGQIKAILRKAPPSSKLHVLFNDATYSKEVIKGRNIEKLKQILKRGVQGGGGSVFNEVFRDPVLKKVDAIIFLSDFYIFIPDDLKINRPLILLHTEHYDKGILHEFEKRSKFHLTLPAGRLE